MEQLPALPWCFPRCSRAERGSWARRGTRSRWCRAEAAARGSLQVAGCQLWAQQPAIRMPLACRQTARVGATCTQAGPSAFRSNGNKRRHPTHSGTIQKENSGVRHTFLTIRVSGRTGVHKPSASHAGSQAGSAVHALWAGARTAPRPVGQRDPLTFLPAPPTTAAPRGPGQGLSRQMSVLTPERGHHCSTRKTGAVWKQALPVGQSWPHSSDAATPARTFCANAKPVGV